MKRYTIELRIVEVTDDGDTLPREVEGATADWATTDTVAIEWLFGRTLDDINETMSLSDFTYEERRPEEEM